ncbi:bifunctional metallophosphatase/5'-nucleotidase, partial [Enterococcus faecium]
AYHGGFEKDLETGEPTELLTGENEGYDLLEKVPGIDALVTGHQHRESATKLNGIPVIQPGFRGAFVGEITLEIEPMAKGYRVIGSD